VNDEVLLKKVCEFFLSYNEYEKAALI